MPNTLTAKTQYANNDNKKIAYRKFGYGMNDLNTNAPKITTMAFKNVKTQTINVGGIDFYYRKLGDNSEIIVYKDAGHGGIFQYHEDFVKRTLAFLVK